MNDLKIENRPLVIRSHYGDESIALVQWAYEQGLKEVKVVTIDTGFAAESWLSRQELGEAHASSCGFKTTTIISPISFAEAVKGRGEFPSAKFQWCSALLKGLPFLDWLDTWDPSCNAIIMIPKRRAAIGPHIVLSEWIDKCEFHQDRTVWHPTFELTTNERDALLARAGFTPLNHRTLECQPCVNSSKADLFRLSEWDIKKIKDLEQIMNAPFFSSFPSFPDLHDFPGFICPSNSPHHSVFSESSEIMPAPSIDELIQWARTDNLAARDNEHYQDLFYRGCGNHFGCGL